VAALKRRIKEAGGPGQSIFGYYQEDGTRRNLTRSGTTRTLEKVWEEGGYHPLTGHSFRVGGALFRYAMEVPIEEIKKLGRWESDCYQLYIRPYSAKETKDAKRLVKELDVCWENAMKSRP
jgi:hypothetical protein